jgi:hypothetical protein
MIHGPYNIEDTVVWGWESLSPHCCPERLFLSVIVTGYTLVVAFYLQIDREAAPLSKHNLVTENYQLRH